MAVEQLKVTGGTIKPYSKKKIRHPVRSQLLQVVESACWEVSLEGACLPAKSVLDPLSARRTLTGGAPEGSTFCELSRSTSSRCASLGVPKVFDGPSGRNPRRDAGNCSWKLTLRLNKEERISVKARRLLATSAEKSSMSRRWCPRTMKGECHLR